jgi:hypothetical protein
VIIRMQMSMSGPTWRPEVSAASPTIKTAAYIEERSTSLMVSVWLMVHTIERPFTPTSTARKATMTHPAGGTSW